MDVPITHYEVLPCKFYGTKKGCYQQNCPYPHTTDVTRLEKRKEPCIFDAYKCCKLEDKHCPWTHNPLKFKWQVAKLEYDSHSTKYYFHIDGIRCRPKMCTNYYDESKFLSRHVGGGPFLVPTYESTKYWFVGLPPSLEKGVVPGQFELADEDSLKEHLPTFVTAKITFGKWKLQTCPATSTAVHYFIQAYLRYVMFHIKSSQKFKACANREYTCNEQKDKIFPVLKRYQQRDLLVIGTNELIQEHVWHWLISRQWINPETQGIAPEDLRDFVNNKVKKPKLPPSPSKVSSYSVDVGGGMDKRKSGDTVIDEWETMRDELIEELELRRDLLTFDSLLKLDRWDLKEVIKDGFIKTTEYSVELTEEEFKALETHCNGLKTIAKTFRRPLFVAIE